MLCYVVRACLQSIEFAREVERSDSAKCLVLWLGDYHGCDIIWPDGHVLQMLLKYTPSAFRTTKHVDSRHDLGGPVLTRRDTCTCSRC